jgi:hypothetical protein
MFTPPRPPFPYTGTVIRGVTRCRINPQRKPPHMCHHEADAGQELCHVASLRGEDAPDCDESETSQTLG